MGSWDHLRTLELTWSDAARELFGVSDSGQVSYDLFLSLLESDDRARHPRGGRKREIRRSLLLIAQALRLDTLGACTWRRH